MTRFRLFYLQTKPKLAFYDLVENAQLIVKSDFHSLRQKLSEYCYRLDFQPFRAPVFLRPPMTTVPTQRLEIDGLDRYKIAEAKDGNKSVVGLYVYPSHSNVFLKWDLQFAVDFVNLREHRKEKEGGEGRAFTLESVLYLYSVM